MIVDAFIVHVVTEFIGEYPLRHPLKVWRDPSDRISVLRIVTLMCLFAPLGKAIYDYDAPAGSHADRADAGHNLALSQMAVAHQPLAAIIVVSSTYLRWGYPRGRWTQVRAAVPGG